MCNFNILLLKQFVVHSLDRYDEALNKLDKLSAQEFVFSLPSDEDPKEKSEAKKEFYKKQKLNDSLSFVSNFMMSNENSNCINSVSGKLQLYSIITIQQEINIKIIIQQSFELLKLDLFYFFFLFRTK